MGDFDGKKIRNICILAHIDHGKTTLADHLIAAGGDGLVKPTQAGISKYMDSLEEEQRRAITMKSSSISLQYQGHSINLTDSPGHMDFCSEVSSAARSSDGALVLVDAVEGVHIQTHAVLRQAWIEKLTPCLVLNKIDKLIYELRLTPMEAYTRLQRIIHEVNGIMSTYKSEKYLSDVDSILTGLPREVVVDDEDTFQPRKGNVVFVSALYGWGFGIKEFAKFYASESNATVTEWQERLWGPKKGFVQYVLEPLWQVYQSAMDPDGEKDVLKRCINKYKLRIPNHYLQNKDPKVVFQAVMIRWLPLSHAVLSMVIEFMPDPITAQSFRISRLLPNRKRELVVSSNVVEQAEQVRKSVEACDSSPEAPSVVFVSKMFAIPSSTLSQEEPGECFLAFARVFSGVICSGQRVFVLSSLYDPLKGDAMEKHLQEAELQSLYLMMGRDFKLVSSAKAGSIVAIQGLGKRIMKSATLSSTRNCWPFSSMAFQVSPTLRVAIEASDPADEGAVLKGLRLLNRADPFVEVSISASGEHVLAAAGEVHLERCVKDLKERFAKVSLQVSPPVVSYKETIKGDVSRGSKNYVEKVTPNGRCVVRVQVSKLPCSLIKVIETEDKNSIEALKKRMFDALDDDTCSKREGNKCKKKWRHCLERIWTLGPRRVGPNILIAPDPKLKIDESSILVRGSHVSAHEPLSMEAQSLESSVVAGFELATASGPLCDEPMWGLAFLVEAYLHPKVGYETSSYQNNDQYGILAGQVMTAVKDACREAVLQRKPRIVEAMFFCELSTPTEHLGPMYAVLGRRRARMLKEEMQEGLPVFTVHAYLPVSESFGFSEELRRSTSGASSAVLVLSHWEVLAEDPFFVPKTKEEVEELGSGVSVLPNIARKLVDSVRRRKGLPIEEKVVMHAAKQRTRSRKV